MYINTPKRYRGMQRRKVFSCGRFLMGLIVIALIGLAAGIYQMRDFLRPRIMTVVDAVVQEADTWQSTQFAPTAQPTVDPSRTLVDADNNWQLGRISIALESYRNILAIVPNNVQVYNRLAMGLLTRGDVETATRYAENSVTADPFNPDAWSIRSLVYAWENDNAQSISSAQQALALMPNDPRATAYLAYAYFQAGQGELARSRANDAIALNPNAWEGYWVRGLINENVFPPDVEAAYSDFETAYTLASEQNPAMAGLAASGLARTLTSPTYGQVTEAITVLTNSLAIDPDNADVLYYLGLIYYASVGDYGQAQDTLTDCIRVAPEDYNCWYLLGRSRFSLGNQDGALDAFEQAVALDTPYARHYWWAASVEQGLGSCSRAATYLEIGYDMVREGGLPAADEGDTLLTDSYDYLIGICRIPVTIAPEATQASDEQ